MIKLTRTLNNNTGNKNIFFMIKVCVNVELSSMTLHFGWVGTRQNVSDGSRYYRNKFGFYAREHFEIDHLLSL